MDSKLSLVKGYEYGNPYRGWLKVNASLVKVMLWLTICDILVTSVGINQYTWILLSKHTKCQKLCVGWVLSLIQLRSLIIEVKWEELTSNIECWKSDWSLLDQRSAKDYCVKWEVLVKFLQSNSYHVLYPLVVTFIGASEDKRSKIRINDEFVLAWRKASMFYIGLDFFKMFYLLRVEWDLTNWKIYVRVSNFYLPK